MKTKFRQNAMCMKEAREIHDHFCEDVSTRKPCKPPYVQDDGLVISYRLQDYNGGHIVSETEDIIIEHIDDSTTRNNPVLAERVVKYFKLMCGANHVPSEKELNKEAKRYMKQNKEVA